MKKVFRNDEIVLTTRQQSAKKALSSCFRRIDYSGLPGFRREKKKSNVRMYEKGKSFPRGNEGSGVKIEGLSL
jgi:hypothetical protein